MYLHKDLLQMTDQVKDNVIQWRRYLHENPELSFHEYETSQFIYNTLKSFENLEVSRPTKTSVMARLIGNKGGKTIAIRADIDALPIKEENTFEYVSKKPGIMHACGHDGHTAIALGVAQILSQLKDKTKGEVRFLFQHGEEKLPGGAGEMVKAGVMNGVDFVIGAHLWSQFETGEIFTIDGPLMAAADVFNIEIIGKGGHSAEPHNTIDALAIGTQVVNNLQHILSRNMDPFDDVVLSVTKFNSGSSHSIIPNTASLVGSVRTFNQEVRESVPVLMEKVIHGLTSAHGASYEFNYEWGYSPVINHQEPTETITKTVTDLFGKEALLDRNPMMISEDFSAFQQEAPGCFFLIGAGNKEKEIHYPHHHPKFTIDEESLDIGVKVFVNAIFNFQ